MKILSLDKVSSGYGKKQIIHDVSLDINQGEIAVLIGSNGAGKSTVLRTIFGLNKIWNNGKILFEGQIISNWAAQRMNAAGIVYIPQKNNCFEELTVADNLNIAGFAISKELLSGQLEEIFSRFPMLANRRKKIAGDLSGGQRQLLALSMALIHKPKLVLFDEPSLGLDVKNLRDIFKLIGQLNTQQGINFLIVEHRIREIAPYANKFVGLKQGRVVYSHDSFEEIAKAENIFV